MDDEPEVTRAQMDETRASLSEKLETLEHQVVDSVQDTSNAVHDTVAGVKDMFDLHLQVQRHPWLIVGGSIALGYLGGYLLLRRGSDRPTMKGFQQSASPDGPRTTRQHNGVVKEHRFAEEAS